MDVLLALVDRRLKKISLEHMIAAQRSDPSLQAVIAECEGNGANRGESSISRSAGRRAIQQQRSDHLVQILS